MSPGTPISAEHCLLGRWLRTVRGHHHVTQAHVGLVIGLPQPKISALEAGCYETSYTVYVRLCRWAADRVAECGEITCLPPQPLLRLVVTTRQLGQRTKTLLAEARAIQATTEALQRQLVDLITTSRELRAARQAARAQTG